MRCDEPQTKLSRACRDIECGGAVGCWSMDNGEEESTRSETLAEETFARDVAQFQPPARRA